MNNLKRFTICKLIDHKWLKIAYPAGSDGERSGLFLRCQRAAKRTTTRERLPAARALASSSCPARHAAIRSRMAGHWPTCMMRRRLETRRLP